jgi:hypothetical protein
MCAPSSLSVPGCGVTVPSPCVLLPRTGRALLRDSHSPAGRRSLTVLERSCAHGTPHLVRARGLWPMLNLRRGLAGPQPGPQGLPAGASPTGRARGLSSISVGSQQMRILMGRGSASVGATRHVASSQPRSKQASPRTRRAKLPAKATLQVVTARVGGDAVCTAAPPGP